MVTYTKGKTWEKLYGVEQANLMKKNLAEITRRKFKGISKSEEHKQKIIKSSSRTYEERMGFEKSQQMKQLRSLQMQERNKNIRGKTYKEIYGEEKAKEKIENQRQKLLGKTYEQKYGGEIAKQRKEKISKAGKKWTTEKLIAGYKQIVEQNGPILRSEIVNFAKKGIISYEQAIINELGSLDKLVEITGIEFKQPKLLGRKGKNEESILNIIEQQIGSKVLRNYYVAGKWVDGYVPQLNTIFEVDEKYHQYRQVQDRIREEHIKNNINCNIIRINEQTFLNNQNNKVINDFIK